MGAIMSIGVATATASCWCPSRASGSGEPRGRDHGRRRGRFTRFRPVLMTALAMIIGMVPMALGLGEGGEQNAPLGRAVIGGLLCATRRHPRLRAVGVRPAARRRSSRPA